ncbi:MAG TPA: hypothetical protein VGF71_12685 [Caulobacteraceae bacterium]|jgi:hypothetical protein
MRLIGVVAAMAVVLSSSVSKAQLRGAERSNFVTGFNRTCIAGFRSNQMMADVPSRSAASICGCVSRRVADTIDYRDTWSRYKVGSGPQVPPELRDAMMEGVQYCISRRSDGFAPMKVTPNR